MDGSRQRQFKELQSACSKAPESEEEGTQKGSRKEVGSANARNPRKQQWMATIRAQRRTLKEMREDGTLERSQYRHYYLKAKGGSYRSISHAKAQMSVEGIKIGGEQ